MVESVLIIAMSKAKIQGHMNNWSYSKLLELLKLIVLLCAVISQ